MIFAYLAMLLGVAVLFVPGPYRPAVLVLVIALGWLYVRAMNRRAREDVR